MNAFVAVVIAGLTARLGYQMARSPVLPLFAEDLGAGPELLGLIVAASTVTGIFMKLPSGVLSDLLGRKRLMVLGGVFFAAPPFLYPFVDGPGSLLALRFVHGLATAIFSPVAAAYVASLAVEARGARLGWMSSANDVGSTLGPLLGGLLLFATARYDVVYLLVGFMGVLTFLVILRLPDTSRPAPAKPSSPIAHWRFFREGLWEVLTHPPVIIVSLAEAVMYLGFGAFLGFLPVYARANSLNEAEIAVVLAGQMTTAIVAKPVAGLLSDRLGRKAVIVAGLMLCAVSLPLIFRSTELVTMLITSALLGLGVAAVTPVTNALIADLVREQRLGAAMGVFGTIWDAGEAAGPIFVGLLIGGLGYTGTFTVIAAIIAGFTCVFLLAVTDPKAAPPPVS